MKRFALCLALFTMIPAFVACSDDDDNSNNDPKKNENAISLPGTVDDACNYLVPRSGDNTFEMMFDPDKASEETIKKAKELCKEEINGVPFCKDAYIAHYACKLGIQNGQFDTAQFDEAVKKCANDDKDCYIKALTELHPCSTYWKGSDECEQSLSHEDQDKLHEYQHSYMNKYQDL